MEQILVTRCEAARMLSISTDTLDRLAKSGRLRKVTIGARTYYSPEELRAFTQKEGPLC